MAESEFDELAGGNAYVFPEADIPEQELQYEAGGYLGILGRITPFFAGKDGKKIAQDHPDAKLNGIWQELWVLQFLDALTPDKKDRIKIVENNPEFWKPDARGVKILESHVAPSNLMYSKLAWKIPKFYEKFPSLFEGETGKKKIVWERVKKLYGTIVFFMITYNPDKKNPSKTYRNVDFLTPQYDKSSSIVPKQVDITIMNKIELLYNTTKKELEAAKAATSIKQPDSNLDDVFVDGEKPVETQSKMQIEE